MVIPRTAFQRTIQQIGFAVTSLRMPVSNCRHFHIYQPVEKPITVRFELLDYFICTMRAKTNNVIQFPIERRREISGCPHCGASNEFWQIGRLLWGYCEDHELRWVVANHSGITRATINRRELRRGLEFLSSFVEVTR
jgi:hypothetical protein